MSRVVKPSEAEEKAWQCWLAARPPAVRAVAATLDPWTLYRIRSSGQRVTVLSVNQHRSGEITITVLLSKQFNLMVFEHRVFGLKRDDLEECDLPAASEPRGAALTSEEDIRKYIEAVRPEVIRRRNAKEWK